MTINHGKPLCKLERLLSRFYFRKILRQLFEYIYSMRKIVLVVFLLFAKNLFAQTIINRDPEISQMISEISKDSLQSYISALVAFGTRNTLSTQSDPQRGIGAARNWVLRKFNEFAENSSG